MKQKEQNLHQYVKNQSKIGNWFKTNKLTLNLDKTLNLNLNTKGITGIDNIKIGTDDVKKGFYTKSLGIHMDSKLGFKFHINLFVK